MFMISENKPLHHILREVMDDHGLKMTAWPKGAGLSPNTLKIFFQKAEAGEDVTLTYRVLDRLASVIGMTAAEMLGAEQQATQIVVSGYVQAGLFSGEHFLERERYEALPENLLGEEGITALEVRGDSMDQMLPSGSVIFVREINVHIAQGFSIRSGMLVVAVRERDGEREYTVKQLEQRDDGSLVLHPRSTNALHRPIEYAPGPDFVHGRDLQNEECTVQIQGIVCGAHVSYI